jgi:hypothetical protein
MRRCRRGDRGRQTEGRFRSMLLQPRGERGWHSRRRKVLLARRHADACEILPRQEEECAGFLDSPEAGAANSGANSLRLGQRELRWALVSSCSARKMGGRRPEKRHGATGFVFDPSGR